MSSMFKSVLNSFGNGGSESKKLNNAEDLIECSSDDVNQDNKQDDNALSNNGNSSHSGKHNFGKKGRKKLTAMMGKMMHNSKSKNKDNLANRMNDQNNNSKSDTCEQEEEDDDLFYDLEMDPTQTMTDNLAKSQKKRLSLVSNGSEYKTDKEENGKTDLLPEELCDIPTFLHSKNCDQYLIEETRKHLKERYAKNPDSFYDTDYQRMLTDDWTVSRFLLRRRLDPRRTAKLIEECGKFRKQYKMSEIELWEFPVEFHKAGGLFKYAKDRVGNVTVYMRVKMYRKVPEISDVFKAFILCVLEEADLANNGRGVAVVFDLSGCGLQNVDLGFLSWLLSSFRNYCPKGVSYILVYNLPWILNATCKMAMTWMSASNRRALRFCYGDEIENFIAKENLPDYCGGTCEINYKSIPEGSLPATEVCDRLDLTKEQALKIRELFKEYLDEDDYARCKDSKHSKKQRKRDKLKLLKQQQKQQQHSTTGGDYGSNEEVSAPGNNSINQSSSTELVMQASKFSVV